MRNLAYMVAKSGELPKSFTRGVWHGGTVGLFVAAAITALFVLFFPLAAVGQMASLAFLIVYGMVSVGHLRVCRDTGARRWLLIVAVLLNLGLFVLLLGYTIHTGPASTWLTLIAVLVGSFVFEIGYRRPSRRARQATPEPDGSTPGTATHPE